MTFRQNFIDISLLDFSALFAVFCLLLFIGAMVHSRCVLIVFSICGLFSIIVLWLLSSVSCYLSIYQALFLTWLSYRCVECVVLRMSNNIMNISPFLFQVYIASAVALADFCHKPSPWVQYALGEQLDYDVSEYYLSCRPGVSNPFDNFLSVRQ